MIYRCFILFVGIFFCVQPVWSQKYDHNWMLGYSGSGFHEETRLFKIPFSEGVMQPFEYVYDSAGFFRFAFNFTATVMSDSAGELVFYYNGFQIRDRFNQVPPGGDTLNVYWYWLNLGGGDLNLGLPIEQSSLALPVPQLNDEYIILTGTAALEFINFGQVVADKVFTHRVKRTVAGLDVVYSNATLLEGDSLTPGGYTAVRHANGRDWWLLFGKLNPTIDYIVGYYKYLLTPAGLMPAGYQAFDLPVHAYGAGQYCYNHTGDKLIMATSHLIGEPGNLVIFDFDRCTGELSNMKHHLMEQDVTRFNGCAVSPNNRYLYASGLLNIYQYDLEAEDIFASEQIVGVIDTTVFTPNFVTTAGNARLAPDGKIYFANGSSTKALNVIHYPDSAGVACGFEQNGFPLPVYNFRTIPNFPNYCLGALEGSPCDTLGKPYSYCATAVNTQDVPIESASRSELYPVPNPAQSKASLTAPEAGLLHLYDISGRLYRQHTIAQGEVQLDISSLAAGLYLMVLYGESGYVYRDKLAVVE